MFRVSSSSQGEVTQHSPSASQHLLSSISSLLLSTYEMPLSSRSATETLKYLLTGRTITQTCEWFCLTPDLREELFAHAPPPEWEELACCPVFSKGQRAEIYWAVQAVQEAETTIKISPLTAGRSGGPLAHKDPMELSEQPLGSYANCVPLT